MSFPTRAGQLTRERAGESLGWAAAPWLGAGAAARRSRVLHPDGIVLAGSVTATSPWGETLTGPVLARFSGALWKRPREWWDVLGCAVRFRDDRPIGPEPGPFDQDLLFATIRSPMTMPFAPLSTRVHDYLGNSYFGAAPFDMAGAGRVKLRLVPLSASPPGKTRDARLRAALEGASITLALGVRRTWTRCYVEVARVQLTSVVDLDQEVLRFDPFRNGRGIRPRGFVHALRRGAYAGSRRRSV